MTGTRIAPRAPFTRWVDAYDWVERNLPYLTHARYDDVLAAASALDYALLQHRPPVSEADALLAAVNAAVAQTSYTEAEE